MPLRLVHLTTPLILSSILFGCAKQQLATQATIQLEAAQQAQQTTTSVEQIIEQARQALDKAIKDDMTFYAPVHMANARDSLEQAQSYLENPPEDQKNAAMMSAIAARKIIEKSYESKRLVEAHLKKTFANQSILEKLGIDASFQDRYEDILEDITDLIALIETGETQSAITQQDSVIETMIELEIDILLERHLDPALRFLEKAEDVEAEDYAPLSFHTAITEIEDAMRFIENNNRNRIGVKEAGKQALTAVQHAYYVAQDVRPLINMMPEETEAHVLSLIEMIKQINQEVSSVKLAPQPYRNANLKVAELSKLLKQQNTSLTDKLTRISEALDQANSTPVNAEPSNEANFPIQDHEVSVSAIEEEPFEMQEMMDESENTAP